MKGTWRIGREATNWGIKRRKIIVLSGDASKRAVSGAAAALFLWAHFAALEIMPSAKRNSQKAEYKVACFFMQCLEQLAIAYIESW